MNTLLPHRCFFLLMIGTYLFFGQLLSAQGLAVNHLETNPAGLEKKQQESKKLIDVLHQLEDQFGVTFDYDLTMLEGKRVPTLLDAEMPEDIDQVLKKMLSPHRLRYEKLYDKSYLILEETTQPKLEKKAASSLLGPLTISPPEANRRRRIDNVKVYRLEKTITGQVTDLSTNETLPGVNIVVKNTTIGTVTDIDGNYRLTVPDDAQTVVFSSVGYTGEEVAIGNQTVINLAMAPDIQSLSEVVVVGYGTQKKSDLTGAVSSVQPEEITRLSERQLENALQGRAAGVQVARGEGSPGSGSKVTIRGAGSLGNTSPLYVIDGVPQAPGNFFNMNDVESIEILKDASAAAIYGARAAHGVILITTKRGGAGKTNVNFRTSIGQRRAVALPNMLTTPDFIAGASEARRNAGVDLEPSWDDPEALPNINWADQLFGSGLEQTYNLSVAGGSENANFFISGGYDKEEGIMIDNSFERFSLRANSDFKIGKKLKIGESVLISRTQENPTAQSSRDLVYLYRAVPTMPVRDSDNPFGGWGRGPGYFAGANPVAIQRQNHINNRNTRINGNVYAEVEPVEGLTLRGSFGANLAARVQRAFGEAFDYGQLGGGDGLTYLSTDDEQFNTNLVLTYTNTIGQHNFTVLGGYEHFRQDGIQFSASANEFPLRYAESFALSAGEVNIPERETIDAQYRLHSQFGRVSYSYADKYLLTANVRRDGSSRFGSVNQYGVFPSVSVGWRIIEENFMQNATFFSNLKLRASYGVLGSDRIGDYLFAPTYSNDRSSYVMNASGVRGGNKVRGFYLRRFPNAEIQWEEVRQTNLGLDVGFLEGKLNLTADYYIKTTTEMLYNVQLPLSYGVSQDRSGPNNVPVNVGQMENRGLELALDYRYNLNDWQFNISANAAWNANELLSLDTEEDEITRNLSGQTTSIDGSAVITRAGEPVGSFYGYEVEGIFQSEAEVQQANDAAPDGVYQANGTAPGDLRYRDISGPDGVPDGEITADDRTILGNPWPDLAYGLNINVGYRGFDLTLFLQGVQGADIFNATKAYYRSFFSDYNATDLVFERWTAENPTEHPRLNVNDPNGNFSNASSYFVEDGSYLKLRNIQLGYTLPESLLSSLGLTNARVFVNAQNILTFTRYEGLDPEVSNGDGSNTLQGLDDLTRYPQTRLVSAGLQIGF